MLKALIHSSSLLQVPASLPAACSLPAVPADSHASGAEGKRPCVKHRQARMETKDLGDAQAAASLRPYFWECAPGAPLLMQARSLRELSH